MLAPAAPGSEAARRHFAAERIAALEALEQRLLERAVGSSDDAIARWLEWWADAAWRDAEALRREHAEGKAEAP